MLIDFSTSQFSQTSFCILSRGNPLFLDKGRYERIQNYWLKHKIPTTIVQAMEKNRNLLAFDWNMI